MKLTGKGPVTIFILNSHPATIPYEDIERIVCEVMGMSPEQMFKESRRTELKTARQLLCFYARTHTSMSYLSIGEKVGNFHHSTVIHSVDRIKGLIEADDKDISRYVKEINTRIAQVKGDS
jgi:chromosomal replication initiator protein